MTPSASRRVKVGLVGSQFITTIHAESLHRCAGAELYAVASPTPGNAKKFAEKWKIVSYKTMDEVCADPAVEIVIVALPNEVHLEAVEIAG